MGKEKTREEGASIFHFPIIPHARTRASLVLFENKTDHER